MEIMENETEKNQKQRRTIAVDEELVAYYDVSGMALGPTEVIKAWLEEMEWMRMKELFKNIEGQKQKQDE